MQEDHIKPCLSLSLKLLLWAPLPNQTTQWHPGMWHMSVCWATTTLLPTAPLCHSGPPGTCTAGHQWFHSHHWPGVMTRFKPHPGHVPATQVSLLVAACGGVPQWCGHGAWPVWHCWVCQPHDHPCPGVVRCGWWVVAGQGGVATLGW